MWEALKLGVHERLHAFASHCNVQDVLARRVGGWGIP